MVSARVGLQIPYNPRMDLIVRRMGTSYAPRTLPVERELELSGVLCRRTDPTCSVPPPCARVSLSV